MVQIRDYEDDEIEETLYFAEDKKDVYEMMGEDPDDSQEVTIDELDIKQGSFYSMTSHEDCGSFGYSFI